MRRAHRRAVLLSGEETKTRLLRMLWVVIHSCVAAEISNASQPLGLTDGNIPTVYTNESDEL